MVFMGRTPFLLSAHPARANGGSINLPVYSVPSVTDRIEMFLRVCRAGPFIRITVMRRTSNGMSDNAGGDGCAPNRLFL
jgi:hypothetical protein